MDSDILIPFIVVCLLFGIGIIGYDTGRNVGRKEVASGEYICEQTPLKRIWECVVKEDNDV